MISDREDRVRTAAERVGLTLAAIQGDERTRFRLLCLVNGNRLTNPDDPDRGKMFALDWPSGWLNQYLGPNCLILRIRRAGTGEGDGKPQ